MINKLNKLNTSESSEDENENVIIVKVMNEIQTEMSVSDSSCTEKQYFRDYSLEILVNCR